MAVFSYYSKKKDYNEDDINLGRFRIFKKNDLLAIILNI